jgi:dolichol-phosphate mannosyltransferase
VVPRDFLRFVRFAVLGGVTAVINIGLLWLLSEAGINAIAAYAIGMAIALQFNFLASQAFVWQDRGAGSWRVLAERWVTFHTCTAASIAVNMAAFIVARLFMPDIAAAIVGLAISTVVKFMSLDRLAFKDAQTARSDLPV